MPSILSKDIPCNLGLFQKISDTRDGVWRLNIAVVVNRHGCRITLWCEFWCLANSDGQTKAGNCEGARETRRDNELDGEAADQLGWPWRWRGRLKEEESTDQRLAEMSCLLIGRDQSQIRSGPTCKRLLQGVKAIGSTILGTKSNSSLTLCKEIEVTCDNQMSRWQEEPQEHGQSHDQVVSEDCLQRRSLEGTNVLNVQREDSGEGGDVVSVWRKEATRS